MASMSRNSLRSCARIAETIPASSGSARTARFTTTCRTSSRSKGQDAQSHEPSSRRRYHSFGRNQGENHNKYESIPILSFFFGSFFGGGSDDTPDLTPFKYTKHRVLSVKRISPQHVLVDIQVSDKSRAAFGNFEPGGDGLPTDDTGNLDIWHVYVKSPDLQIERPYTPINDVEKDGFIRLLVKRVKGGEVGRYLHFLAEGDDIEIRGPIKTVSVPIQSLDYLTMISTGTGVAPFLQFICKVANVSANKLEHEQASDSSIKLPKVSLIQYLPRNSHASSANLPSTSTTTQASAVSESLPVEEFDSTTEAGPDIIRHPDVLSPVIRGHLVDQGTLRLLRVQAGQPVDQPLLIDSLTATRGIEQTSSPSSIDGEPTKGPATGSWFGWLSSSGSASAPSAESVKTAEAMNLQNGKMDGSRVGVMACLPVQSLIPLAGPQYPMGRTKPPIAGILGDMGFDRSNVWIL